MMVQSAFNHMQQVKRKGLENSQQIAIQLEMLFVLGRQCDLSAMTANFFQN